MKIKRFLKWYYIPRRSCSSRSRSSCPHGRGRDAALEWLLPPLFGWPQITLLAGVGLLVLCRILFGGFGSGGGRHPKDMTPEERERFRRRMRERFRDSPGEGQETTYLGPDGPDKAEVKTDRNH